MYAKSVTVCLHIETARYTVSVVIEIGSVIPLAQKPLLCVLRDVYSDASHWAGVHGALFGSTFTLSGST